MYFQTPRQTTNLDPLKSQMTHKLHKTITQSKPITSRTTLKQTLYKYLKKLENGSKIFTLDYVNMAGVRGRGALLAGCGRPLVR